MSTHITNDGSMTFHDAILKSPTQIEVNVNNSNYTYNRTKKEYKGVSYFQCTNRHRNANTGRKCMAKLQYYNETNSIKYIDLHNISCGINNITINEDFNTQKQDIFHALNTNPGLSVNNAIDILRENNHKALDQDKRQPLNYMQVKGIIRQYRQENNVNTESSISDISLLKTLDGAIFRRCYDTYDIIYKNRLVHNTYFIYCSPFQQRLLADAKHWHVDGTFYIVPNIFYQLLVIVLYVDVIDAYVPVCFCLASTLDFENAEKQGIQRVFPETKFIGCKFHFMQALVRKAKKKDYTMTIIRKR